MYEKISKCEDRFKDIMQSKEQRGKKMRRMNKAREMWDIIKHMKRCIIGVPE